jgi:hypothetical protein
MRKQPSQQGSDSHEWDARAQEALDEARRLPHGPARTEAMKKAGQLRLAANMKESLATSLAMKPVKPTNSRSMPPPDGDTK